MAGVLVFGTEGRKRCTSRVLVKEACRNETSSMTYVDGCVILKCILNRLIWLRLGKMWPPLWTWHWTFGFHKMRDISWLAERPLGFQDGPFSMELVKKSPTFKSSRLYSFPRLCQLNPV